MKLLWLTLFSLLAHGDLHSGGEDWEGAPIHYESEVRQDAVSRLQAALAAGEFKPEREAERGWLVPLMDAFGVTPASQVLVFSKTSFQLKLISPETPRALYFGEDVYLAWIPGAPIMEITTIDPLQGATFYVVDQREPQLRFQRKDEECLVCHGGPRTRNWPGNIIRSVHPRVDGEPIFRSGTFRTTQNSPLEERWGGWYVTGTHGAQRHMGNALVVEGQASEMVDLEAGANVVDLSTMFDVQPYLTGHSDLVALMVLEHQTEMQNLIARASYEGRIALAYQRELNEQFDEPQGHVSESTQNRLTHVAQLVVDHLLFRGEAILSDPVAGTSVFAREFSASGKLDSQGRSLRQLDLQGRLFQFPCSYLIHSAAFDALPAPVLRIIYQELGEILNNREASRDFSHLSKEDRKAILEILRETKVGLPSGW